MVAKITDAYYINADGTKTYVDLSEKKKSFGARLKEKGTQLASAVLCMITLAIPATTFVGCEKKPVEVVDVDDTHETFKAYNTELEKCINTQFKNIIEQNSYADIIQHPYTTLEKMGFDTLSIKQGIADCETISYFKEGDTEYLYVAVSANNSDNSVTTDITGKYKISEKEYKYYNELLDANDPRIILVVPALDALGRFEETSCVKITAEAKTNLNEGFKISAKSWIEELRVSGISSFIIDANQENNSFSCILIDNACYASSPNMTDYKNDATIYQWDMLGLAQNIQINENGIMTSPNTSTDEGWYLPRANRKAKYFSAKVTSFNNSKIRALLAANALKTERLSNNNNQSGLTDEAKTNDNTFGY